MINNNELFAKVLAENPLPYHFGDKVSTNRGIGYISGYNFKEREKTWIPYPTHREEEEVRPSP